MNVGPLGRSGSNPPFPTGLICEHGWFANLVQEPVWKMLVPELKAELQNSNSVLKQCKGDRRGWEGELG